LMADDTYHVRVQASPAQAGSTGNYVLSVIDATIHDAQVNLNQSVTSKIDTPYRVERWHFSAAAGQQIRFDLINATTSAIQFDLTGPGNWSGFSGLASSSNLITLPTSGSYTL